MPVSDMPTPCPNPETLQALHVFDFVQCPGETNTLMGNIYGISPGYHKAQKYCAGGGLPCVVYRTVSALGFGFSEAPAITDISLGTL